MARKFRNAFGLVLFYALVLLYLAGCQMDVTGGVKTKLFYPDNVGAKKLGDPRRAMYEGSGYVEQEHAGGDVVAPREHFKGLKEGK